MKKLIAISVIPFFLVLFCNRFFPSSPVPGSPKLLLISFDGFRYDYLSKTNTPHFDSFVKEGVIADGLIPVFPTLTFLGHYSMVTGLFPENSGLVGNTMYDPLRNRWYRISNRNAVEDRSWYQGEPVWNTAEKQGVTTGTLFWVGSEAGIQNRRPTYWKRFDVRIPERSRIDTVLSWYTRKQKPVELATLYFEFTDQAGHEYGLKSDSLIAAIRKADRLLGYLRDRLVKEDLWNVLNIMIVSDHGMVDLAADKTIGLDSRIDMQNVERIIHGAATMIQPAEGKTDLLYDQLKKSEEHYHVYRKRDLPARYRLKHHRRIPPLILVADLGYTFVTEDYREQFLRRLPGASHGFDNRHREMQAFFAARGPAFVQGDTVSVFQYIHLYELMCHILDIKPAPNDGALDSVRILLNKQ